MENSQFLINISVYVFLLILIILGSYSLISLCKYFMDKNDHLEITIPWAIITIILFYLAFSSHKSYVIDDYLSNESIKEKTRIYK